MTIAPRLIARTQTSKYTWLGKCINLLWVDVRFMYQVVKRLFEQLQSSNFHPTHRSDPLDPTCSMANLKIYDKNIDTLKNSQCLRWVIIQNNVVFCPECLLESCMFGNKLKMVWQRVPMIWTSNPKCSSASHSLGPWDTHVSPVSLLGFPIISFRNQIKEVA